MGWFPECFGKLKSRKQRSGSKKVLPSNKVNQDYQPAVKNLSAQKFIFKEETDVSAVEPKENNEQVKLRISPKKVTFDLNVKTYENRKDSIEYEEAEEVEEEMEAKSNELDVEEEEIEGKANRGSKYRYENCESSDDEGTDVEEEDEFFDDGAFIYMDDEIDVASIGAESYGSFFSLPMDKEKRKSNCEVDNFMPASADSVLDLIDRLPNNWKDIGMRVLPSKNITENNKNEIETKVNEPQMHSDLNSTQCHRSKDEIFVEASLSSWLISSGNSQKEESERSYSQVSREDKPILGALPIEDLKHSSASFTRKVS